MGPVECEQAQGCLTSVDLTANCPTAGTTRSREQQGNANTTWVPIPIHKVEEVTESEERKVDNNYNRNVNYHVQQPQQRSTPGQSRSVPIQLASPNLIIKAGKQKDLPAKDELFPRKKKSEFTI